MTSFKYAAKKPGGQTVEGTLAADDKGQAIAELRRQNLVVIKLEQVAGDKPARKAGTSFFSRSPKVNSEELVLFTRQLATMVGAGLALLESIDVLGSQAETPGLRQVCEKIGNELRGGSDLSSAMETCPRAFTSLYVSMVRAGEASGQMDVILERLADYLESSQALRREIKAAMTYPVISLVLVIGITAFLMLGVVPTFRQVFDGLGAELPGLTQFTLNTSAWLKENWYVVLGAAFGSFAAFSAFKKTPKGELLWHHFVLRAPIFGPIVRKIALARFSRTFATLIRSGVPIMGTLDIVSATAGNRVVSNTVDAAKESVRQGQLLSDPLAHSKVFPPMVTRMIAIGERTGALEQLLEKIAEFYDQQVEAEVKGLTSMIEPIMIAVMGVVVGGIVLAVFLPIFKLQEKLSGG